MKTKLITILIFFIFQISFGQLEPKSALKLGIGSQRNFFSEIGYQYKINQTVRNGCIYSYAPSAMYTTIEWTTKTKNFDAVYGLKIGYEKALNYVLSYAIEAKYQTNFNNNDFVITPKIGLFATNHFSLFYGYNISTNSNPFGNVGRHQFSLIFNLNAATFGIEKSKKYEK